MKRLVRQLPVNFPIRYAVVFNNENNENENVNGLNNVQEIEMVFWQYVLKLQEDPITKDNIRRKAKGLRGIFLDTELFDIAKLDEDIEWINRSVKALTGILPELNIGYVLYDVFINPFLYSYRGACETPCFLNIMKSWKKDKSFDAIRNKFGYSGSEFWSIHEKYKAILNNTIGDLELAQLLSGYKQPLKILIPYSYIWKILDSIQNNGFFFKSADIDNSLNKKILLQPPTNINSYQDKKIEVIVCRNWNELFAEELSAFYKTLTRCKNCNKPLPFNYNGRYCPNLEENKQCIRERNRKRKSQTDN